MDAQGGGRNRFKRFQRILKPSEYKAVFSRARKSVDGYFTVLFIDSQLARPRLGMAIAKKQVKSAVVRNRIKRVIRESFRIHQHTLPPLDIVVLARRRAAEADSRALHRSLQRHWKRLACQCRD